MANQPLSEWELTQRTWIVEFQRKLDLVDICHDAANTPATKRARLLDQLRVIGFCLDAHADLRNPALYDDLYDFVLDLEALDEGRQPAILKPEKLRGRSTPREVEFKSYVLVAHELAVRAGCPRTQADAEIAKMLTRCGFTSAQHVARTVDDRSGFPHSTILTWRTNMPAVGTKAARVLERRLSRFLPYVVAMLEKRRSRAEILAWIENVIIKSRYVRRLHPSAQHS